MAAHGPGRTPYFDEDLQVAQLKPHRVMVSETAPILWRSPTSSGSGTDRDAD